MQGVWLAGWLHSGGRGPECPAPAFATGSTRACACSSPPDVDDKIILRARRNHLLASYRAKQQAGALFCLFSFVWADSAGVLQLERQPGQAGDSPGSPPQAAERSACLPPASCPHCRPRSRCLPTPRRRWRRRCRSRRARWPRRRRRWQRSAPRAAAPRRSGARSWPQTWRRSRLGAGGAGLLWHRAHAGGHSRGPAAQLWLARPEQSSAP